MPRGLNVRSVPELFYAGEICLDERAAVWPVLLCYAVLEGLKPAGVT